MKDFIKKIVVFISFSLLAMCTLVIVPNYIVKSRASFKIDKDKTILVIGHSHSAYSLNDSILKNSINLSGSGESYFYNYQKLKEVLHNNKQLRTVFIEYTNNNVDSIMDEWTWGYEKMSFNLQFYSPFMSPEDFHLLFTKNSTDLLACYSIATRKHLYRILNYDFNLIDDIGGFKDSKLSKVDELIAKNDFDASISKSHSLSNVNLGYLRKMIDLCRTYGIKTFLIRSPQHALYADLSNENIYRSVLKTQLNDIELLDFDTMNFPNTHYLDLNHLNHKGSKEFSLLFNNLIEKNLLNSFNKQSVIDEAIKNFNESIY